MILLDTDVLWELRHVSSGRGDAAVAAWAVGQSRADLFVSALALAELGAGARSIERADKAGAAALRRWADGAVRRAFDGRILPVDTGVAMRAATLGYANMVDGLIAATALEQGLTLATGNPAAFRMGKVRTVNPWRYTPAPGELPADDGDWRQASRGRATWLRNLFARG
ncbi:PIN domain-containing protein [Sphingomonas sp. Leaf4]|uniref:PIN domain-containing protein n=1 Tax=Sphingomonas sp. Leaf4 TaxID=2876553 RepID=UPI001E39BCF2|nr:PIN domain-containing protein [Sphingomonas sp. Leaf4]